MLRLLRLLVLASAVSSSEVRQLAAQAGALSDAALSEWLEPYAFGLDEVMSRSPAGAALLLHRLQTREPFFAVVGIKGGEVAWLLEPEPAQMTKPDRVEWLDVGHGSMALYYRRWLAEVPLTTVYVLTGAELIRTYEDRPLTCEAADARDLDGDGDYELIVWVEEITPTAACDEAIAWRPVEETGAPLAWSEVLEWNGDAWIWPNLGYEEFFLARRVTLEEQELWVRDRCPAGSADLFLCEQLESLGVTRRLRDWVRRASIRAGR